MLDDPHLKAVLIRQALEIGDLALTRAGVTLGPAEREWFLGSLGRQATTMAAIKPGPDVLERCARTNEICAAEMVKRYTEQAA